MICGYGQLMWHVLNRAAFGWLRLPRLLRAADAYLELLRYHAGCRLSVSVAEADRRNSNGGCAPESHPTAFSCSRGSPQDGAAEAAGSGC
jgi:hypothetical protein